MASAYVGLSRAARWQVRGAGVGRAAVLLGAAVLGAAGAFPTLAEGRLHWVAQHGAEVGLARRRIADGRADGGPGVGAALTALRIGAVLADALGVAGVAGLAATGQGGQVGAAAHVGLAAAAVTASTKQRHAGREECCYRTEQSGLVYVHDSRVGRVELKCQLLGKVLTAAGLICKCQTLLF